MAKVEEKIQHKVGEVAEGRDEFTPFKALFGVWLVVAVVAGFLIVVGVLIWALVS